MIKTNNKKIRSHLLKYQKSLTLLDNSKTLNFALKIRHRKVWGFESPRPYQRKRKKSKTFEVISPAFAVSDITVPFPSH